MSLLLRVLAAPFVNVWRFWTVPVRAEPLAAFRILLALTILGNQLTGFAWRLPEAFGDDPLIPGSTRDHWLAKGGRICVLRGPTGIPLLGHWLPEEAFGEGVRLRGPVHLPGLGTWTPADVFGEGVESWEQGWVNPARTRAWQEWGERPSSAYLLFGIYLTSLALLALGLFTRVVNLAAVVLACTFNNYLSEYINGGDFLMCNGLWLLLLSPAGAAWSVDAVLRRHRGRVALSLALALPVAVPLVAVLAHAGVLAPWLGVTSPYVALWLLPAALLLFSDTWLGEARLAGAPALIPPWSVRLMQVQVAFLYLFVGLTKLADLRFLPGSWWPRGDWIDGEALYWVLNDVAITRWSYAQVPVPVALCQVLTWATLIFEIGFPLFVLWKRTRIPLLIFGVLLHVGIFITLEIGWFSQITLCWYVLYLSGDAVTAAARWLVGLGPPEPPEPLEA
jgi:hypothetical protein